jgi:hypothetical protein
MQAIINELSAILLAELRNPAHFENADKMYKQMFRSEPYPASELLAHFQNNWNDASDIEREMCLLDPLTEFESITGYKYHESLMICDLCNYKGEGEGDPVIYNEVQHLPIFKSKNHSFDMFM